MKRQAIVILGMHRSGTSALGGALNLLGVSAPKTLMPATDANPKGHWESAAIMTALEVLLQAAGSAWDDVRSLDLERMEKTQLSAQRKNIKTVIEDEYADSPFFFIKDPRLCRFFPFFRGILEEMDIRPVVLIPIRNPLEVARSLARRDGFSRPKSLLLWLRHVLEAEFASRELPRYVFSYEELLSDWARQLGRAAEVTGIRWPVALPEAKREIDRFLAAELRHERAGVDEIKADPKIHSWVADAYQEIAGLMDGTHNGANRALDALRGKFDDACGVFGGAIAAADTTTRELRAHASSQAERISSLDQEASRLQALSAAEHARIAELEARAIPLVRAIEDRDRRIVQLEAERNETRSRVATVRERLSFLIADGSLGAFRTSRLGLRLRSFLRYPLSSTRRKAFRASEAAALLSKLGL